jgi:hypothetical protein
VKALLLSEKACHISISTQDIQIEFLNVIGIGKGTTLVSWPPNVVEQQRKCQRGNPSF